MVYIYYVLPFALGHITFKYENIWDITPHFVKIMIFIITRRKKFESCAISVDLLYSGGFMYCTNYVRNRIKYREGFKNHTGFRDACRRRNDEKLLRENLMVMLPIPKNNQFLTVFDSALYSLTAACILELGKMSWDSELFVKYLKEFLFRTKTVRC